ncbi:hypothetical protein O1611_g5522 [Lasiodiplodia mahajangana]|uniref:Uncharacterized protein n=1 Tax=Lasiodiplodia mahajangana TaxID=1108764 RepID=A0ACC2JLH3_9PEZI|nr:hypothetical protein O1611_g5522 [Lasiodiplodia mahajangana]
MTRFELETDLWQGTVTEFTPGRGGQLNFSQAISFATLLMQSISQVWLDDGYERQEVEDYNDLVWRKEWVQARARSGRGAALGTNWAVTSALETEGRLFLLVASGIEHDTGDLNEVENYLVWCALNRHLCSNPQQDLDMTILYVCGTACRIAYLGYSGSGKKIDKVDIRPPVQITEANYKKNIPEILNSLANLSLKSPNLKEIVEQSCWSPSSASLTT